MNDQTPFFSLTTPSPQRPLLGLTILAVEDSRVACDALRLMCVRSGARIRRADCLAAAHRHLKIYLPSVIIVDMGLPDGSGADLIEELTQASPRVELILATSGDAFSETVAIAAGADGFLAKPISSLSDFQDAIVSRLPNDNRSTMPQALQSEAIKPDLVALRDDLVHAVDALGVNPDGATIDYVAQFLSGIARSAHDTPLFNAVQAVARARLAGRAPDLDLRHLTGIVQDRLAQSVTI